ncbi:Protein CBG00542 [Caenorhabditis briggsae]|uniref:Protein CBG00542 n=1 Tax=Caenorhabditis briggsae TaxID=6238 RepID=A8WNM8_CAEBR|nr:Protein CBG00542 [Caenorhabditis briggsae]CAP22083.1 Protein CBG00542 [Caenorhabditis briggsae]
MTKNSSIWNADLSGGSNGDHNVSMEFNNAPSAALSTFSQILKIGTSTMDSTDFPGDVDGLRQEISVNLIDFCDLFFSSFFFDARDFLRFSWFLVVLDLPRPDDLAAGGSRSVVGLRAS